MRRIAILLVWMFCAATQSNAQYNCSIQQYGNLGGSTEMGESCLVISRLSRTGAGHRTDSWRSRSLTSLHQAATGMDNSIAAIAYGQHCFFGLTQITMAIHSRVN